MQFALECAKTDPCVISPFQFLFVTFCKNDSISIASQLNCYSILFHYMFSLSSFICAVPEYSALTILHFHSIQINGTYQKLNYTINYKYALFYLPIHNDGKLQLCISNTSKSHSFGNQYPSQLCILQVLSHNISYLYCIGLSKKNGKYSNNRDKRLILPSILLMIQSLFESNIIFNLQMLFRIGLVHQNAYVLATSVVGRKTINNFQTQQILTCKFIDR